MTSRTAREVLGVSASASSSEVRRAYDQVVAVWEAAMAQGHPGAQARAALELAAVNEAYATLLMRRGSRLGLPPLRAWLPVTIPLVLLTASFLALVFGPAPVRRAPPPAQKALSASATAGARAPQAAGAEGVRRTAERAPQRRPANGDELIARDRTGHGELVIENGQSHDAMVVLTRGGRQTLSVFVHARSTAKVSAIPPDTYELLFAAGDGWNGRGFDKPVGFSKFDRTVSFSESAQRFEQVRVTLHPVFTGNARTSTVPPFSLQSNP